MNAKNKRTVRTVIQLVVGLAAALPLFLAHDTGPAVGLAVAVSTAVTRWFAFVEQIPGFPDWLRVDTNPKETPRRRRRP